MLPRRLPWLPALLPFALLHSAHAGMLSRPLAPHFPLAPPLLFCAAAHPRWLCLLLAPLLLRGSPTPPFAGALHGRLAVAALQRTTSPPVP